MIPKVAPILRPAWVWPAWIKAPWIAMDESGEWYAYSREPVLGCSRWKEGTHTYIGSDAFDFTPPPVSDWRQSKRRNPNL